MSEAQVEEELSVAPRAMRSILVVIELMIQATPATEVQFIKFLLSLQMSAQFAAPEMQPHWWIELGRVMSACLPDPNVLNEWQKKVVNIFMGRDQSLIKRPDKFIEQLDDHYQAVEEEGLDRDLFHLAYSELRKYVFALEAEVERLKEFEFLYGKERRIITA